MKVISVNTGVRKTVAWKGKPVETGIFKSPAASITLGKHDVVNDAVIERKYHGGINKACYIYSADHYDYWKKLYPNLEWDWGMFGENITIKGLDEKNLTTGSQYKIGSAIVEITDPREPCYKLGIRFNDQKIIRDFIQVPYCGTYLKVIQEGEVKPGDVVELIEKTESLSVAETYLNLYKKQP